VYVKFLVVLKLEDLNFGGVYVCFLELLKLHRLYYNYGSSLV